MNVIVPPRVPPEEIDGLLRAFFRAELPHPWPAMKAPAAPTAPARPAPSRPALWRSRLALAASVAVLALGALFLPGPAPRESQGPVPPGLSPGSARREALPPVAPDNVKSSLSLEQTRDGPTKIKVEVQYLPPMK
jgi:anti-sigma factor RsiW